tara:strand:+ start:7058 stop:7552 length:495 start_codon:yes stop_codon:yes gene_type:complete
MQVLDNFLPEHYHQHLENIFLGPKFKWTYNSGTVFSDKESLTDFQFVHDFYTPISGRVSDQFHLIDPLIDLMNVKCLIRVKANLNTYTENIVERDYHTDFDIGGLTAIYYINTNDGYTQFDSGEKIDSVSNRLLIFNSSKLHRGTTTSNSKSRVVINFNYFSNG